MPFTIEVLLLSLLLVSALSLDALVAAFGYGAGKIKIPFNSTLIINLICTAFLAASLFAGKAVSGFLSPGVRKYICFSLLLLIGLIKLCDGLLKSYIRKKKTFDKSIRFKFLSLKFILNVYADPETADADASKILTVGEAAALAVALSVDSLAVGLGLGFDSANPWIYAVMIAFSFVTGIAAVILGCFIGKRIAQKTPLNLSWLSGVILIVLAVSKLF